jgi:rare lipoprotein A
LLCFKSATAGIVAVFMAAQTGTTLAQDTQCGGASWYFVAGGRTASGQAMNTGAMTAAHKSLPFGSKVKVTDQASGAWVVVTINDRGPFAKGRIIDLSKAAATELGFRARGHTKVCITQI